MKQLFFYMASGALAMATPATASITGNGLVSNIVSLQGGVVLFNVDASRSATPNCHVTGPRWAFDGNTPAGQQKLAMLLSAQLSGRQVQVIGQDNCGIWSDTESVNYLVTP